jgi:hypothetical protein
MGQVMSNRKRNRNSGFYSGAILLWLIISTAAALGQGLQIATTVLPPGSVGYCYAYGPQPPCWEWGPVPILASGGSGSYVWLILQGSLPPGLSFDTEAGAINGTPTTAGTSTFTVEVTDLESNSTATATLSILVCGSLSFLTASLPDGTLGVPYNAPLEACGGYPHFYYWQLAPQAALPPGLTLDSDGYIHGIPTTAGTTSFNIQVNDDLSNLLSRGFAITVAPPGSASRTLLSSTPNPSSTTSPVTLSAQVLGQGSTIPTGTVTFQDGDTQIGSADLAPRTNTNLLLDSSFFTNGDAWLCTDYWWCLDSTILTPNYTVSPAGDQTAYRYQATDDTGSWLSQWIYGLTPSQPITFSVWMKSNIDGVQNVALYALDGSTWTWISQDCLATSSWQRCSVTFTPTEDFSEVSLGQPNGPYWPWDVSIWGAQVELGNSPGPYVATAGAPMTSTVALATFTTDSLANGPHTVTAAYGGDTGHDPSSSQPITQKVDRITIANSYPLVNAQVGTPYTAALSAIGGTPPYTWTIALGALPDGLSLGADGVISGTPTGATSTFFAQVADSGDPADSVMKKFSIEIVSGAWCGGGPSLPRTKGGLGQKLGRNDLTGQPSITDVYPNQGVAGANGWDMTIYACLVFDENGSYGTVKVNLPPGFTQVGDPIVTLGSTIQQTVNISSGAQLGENHISIHQTLDGYELDSNELDYYVVPPSLLVKDANLWDNFIKADLIGSPDMSGILKITLNGVNQNFTMQYGSGPVGPGDYSVQMDRPSIPADLYSSITAEWDLTNGGTTPSGEFDVSWRILGVIRHSQYITPLESSCPAQPAQAWIINPITCSFTPISLYSDFIDAINENGTGRSLASGLLQYAAGSKNQCNYPPGADDYNSFAQISTVKGACLTPLDDTAVATNPSPNKNGYFGCKDNLPLINNDNSQHALKFVMDYCPGCYKDFRGTSGHIDDYDPYAQHCHSYEEPDYGNFWTADTYSKN